MIKETVAFFPLLTLVTAFAVFTSVRKSKVVVSALPLNRVVVYEDEDAPGAVFGRCLRFLVAPQSYVYDWAIPGQCDYLVEQLVQVAAWNDHHLDRCLELVHRLNALKEEYSAEA